VTQSILILVDIKDRNRQWNFLIINLFTITSVIHEGYEERHIKFFFKTTSCINMKFINVFIKAHHLYSSLTQAVSSSKRNVCSLLLRSARYICWSSRYRETFNKNFIYGNLTRHTMYTQPSNSGSLSGALYYHSHGWYGLLSKVTWLNWLWSSGLYVYFIIFRSVIFYHAGNLLSCKNLPKTNLQDTPLSAVCNYIMPS
jgi:hypothetical protein